MRYFCRPSVEQAEGGYIPQTFGKVFEPFGGVSLGPNAVLDTDGTGILEIEGEPLAIHAESSSWSFLSAGELAAFQRMKGLRFDELRRSWPGQARASASDFTAHLYRRGLISINGHRAVDAAMFHESANYNEGNLVELLLTEKCNLACPYCLAGANKSMPTMDWEIGKKAVDLAFGMMNTRTLAFEFAGGEPFLQFALMKRLTEYIRNHPFRLGRTLFLSVQTNATLINDERAAWLKENDIRAGISVDGGAAAQNKSRPQVNGRPSFPLLMNGIETLKKHGVSFGALVVLNRYNSGPPGELIEFLLANRIHGFRLNPVVFIGDARKNWNEVGLTQSEVLAYFQSMIRSIASNGHLLLEDNVRSMLDFLTSKQRRTRCMRSQCGAGDTFQAVAANGDIYPCGRGTQSPGLKLGNIFDEGLRSLDEPGSRNSVIGEIRERRPHKMEECRSCDYRQLCQSGCSAQAWERHGSVMHRTPECSFYKTMYPYLMRWLSFDGQAFDALNRCSYFGNQGVRVDHDFAGAPAMPPPPNQWTAAQRI